MVCGGRPREPLSFAEPGRSPQFLHLFISRAAHAAIEARPEERGAAFVHSVRCSVHAACVSQRVTGPQERVCVTCGVCSLVRVLICLNLSFLVTGLAATCLAQACPWQCVGLHFPVSGSWCPGPAALAQEMPADQVATCQPSAECPLPRGWCLLTSNQQRAGSRAGASAAEPRAPGDPVYWRLPHPAHPFGWKRWAIFGGRDSFSVLSCSSPLTPTSLGTVKALCGRTADLLHPRKQRCQKCQCCFHSLVDDAVGQ